jgi:hypothetical protein
MRVFRTSAGLTAQAIRFFSVLSVPVCFALVLLSPSRPAKAQESGPSLRIGTHLGFWWIIQEQVENGVKQPGTGKPAAQESSGFDFKLGRFYVDFKSPDGQFEAYVNLRLERQIEALDVWGAYRPADWLGVYVGQMKFPSTHEVLMPDHQLDFISRATFNRNVGNFALCSVPFTSPFQNINTNNRDLGVALKGALPDAEHPAFTYFAMISNGLGANIFTGASESPEFLAANNFGDYLYGIRLDGYIADWVRLGGHYTINRHDRALLKDKQTVVDFERETWSGDLTVKFPFGLRIEGFYGNGRLNDLWFSQRWYFDYSGWGVWALQSLFDNRLELAIRYDTYSSETRRNKDITEQNNWTFGINFQPNPYLRLQLNYVWKDTVNEYVKDFDDDILFLNIQYSFETGVGGLK